MTISMDEAAVMQAIEVAAVVGSIVAMLVIGLVVYLLVRPPRRRREARPIEADAADLEEMMRLMDRMDERLEVLERAMAIEAADEPRLLETGDSPTGRRTR